MTDAPRTQKVPADVAVVIPTYNSARTLAFCLRSIREQTRAPREIVVVDDERTQDATREIADAAGVRVIVSPARMAASRNEGISTTDTRLLLSVDSDMRLSPTLVERLVEMFDDGADAVTIRERAIGQGFWARGRALDKRSVERTGMGRSIRGFTRKAFEAVGGYDVDLEAGEDLDFHRRVVASGATVRHLAGAYIDHDEGALRLLDATRKKYRYGLTVPAFERKNGWTPLADGMPRRIVEGVTIGLREDPAAVVAFVALKGTELAAGLGGSLMARLQHA